MKCKKCNSEIDDKLLICPKCGAILKEENEKYHHNYANESLRLFASKLTEEEYDSDYDNKTNQRTSIKPLLKNSLFWIVNLLVVISFIIVLFLIHDIKHINIGILSLIFIIYELSSISYQCLFYKAYKEPYYGIIPIYRLKVLFEICNNEGSTKNSRTLLGIILAYVIWYLLSFSPMYGLWFIFFEEAFIIITIVSIIIYIRLRIKVLGDLSMRFTSNSKSSIYAILFPYIVISIYAFSSKYKYTKLNDSYL